jgi:AraC family transcriptional regulator, transcriptional activator of pobA
MFVFTNKNRNPTMRTPAKQPAFLNEVNYFFDISTVESVSLKHGLRHGPVRQPHHQIVWITRGSGYFSIDLEKYRIEDNSAFTIPPGRFHQIMAEGRLSGFVLSFNIDFLYLAIESPGRPFFKEICTDLKRVKMYLMDGGDQALQSLLAGMTREFEAQNIFRLEIVSGLFKVFLIYMKRQSTSIRQEETSCPGLRLFNNFYAKVDNQFRTKKQVADYAHELSVSPNYLSEVVRKGTGHSAGYHIRQRTVQEAKRLVIFNDSNMKTVAYSLGFDDLSHFSKYFKNAAGMNFRDFKKKFTRHVNSVSL